MDEISTCLDSWTTFQTVNSLRQYVHIFYETAVISLLQPTPETYDLFDDINLLSDSKIVYQGPLENVIEFFEQMGFKCPEKNGVADLLLEVSINLALLFSTIITIGFLIRNAISMGVKISLGNNEWTHCRWHLRKIKSSIGHVKISLYIFVTFSEFTEEFRSFIVGRRIADELSIPFDKTRNHPAALATKQYGVGMLDLIKANLSRE